MKLCSDLLGFLDDLRQQQLKISDPIWIKELVTFGISIDCGLVVLKNQESFDILLQLIEKEGLDTKLSKWHTTHTTKWLMNKHGIQVV